MTIKKNYERDSGDLRIPKNRVEDKRETQRVKQRLNRVDLSILDDFDEGEDLVANWEDE
jgi:hypothetical protein